MKTDINGLVNDRELWDKRQIELGASFLQASSWAEFQDSIGSSPHYLSGEGWSCLLLERKTAMGRYLFAPYGPTLKDISLAAGCFKALKVYARDNHSDWLRLEPLGAEPGQLRDRLKKAGSRRAPHEAEPSLTRVINLSQDQDMILASMSQTTRNIIRRNQREPSLTFRTSKDPSDTQLFNKMLDTVAKRKGVGFYDDDYYRKQAEILMPVDMLNLEIAVDHGNPVGTALIHDFAGTASYTYAASLPEARDKNVSALLLWQALVNAKARGNTRMDLYGIAPDEAGPDHPWSGFSSFKKKFGGEVVEHAGTWDIPISPRYDLYRAALRFKKLLRRR